MVPQTPTTFSQVDLVSNLINLTSLPRDEIFELIISKLPELTKEISYSTIAPALTLVFLSYNNLPALSLKERIQKRNAAENTSNNKSSQNQALPEDSMDSDLAPVGVKRSISHPKKDDEKIVNKKTQSSFKTSLHLSHWLLKNRAMFESDVEYDQLITMSFNLSELISAQTPLSNVNNDLFAGRSEALLVDLYKIVLGSNN